MYTVWTDHLGTVEEKDNFKKGLRNCKWLFDRLDQILEQKEQALETNEINPSVYDSTPNWAFKQAHANGAKQVLKVIRKLIDISDQEDK
jgi:hypothetical protein